MLTRKARLHATQKGQNFYDPGQAVALAEKACNLSDFQIPQVVNTLAIAYAAADKHTQAIETGKKALELAIAQDKKDLARDIREWLSQRNSGT